MVKRNLLIKMSTTQISARFERIERLLDSAEGTDEYAKLLAQWHDCRDEFACRETLAVAQ